MGHGLPPEPCAARRLKVDLQFSHPIFATLQIMFREDSHTTIECFANLSRVVLLGRPCRPLPERARMSRSWWIEAYVHAPFSSTLAAFPPNIASASPSVNP